VADVKFRAVCQEIRESHRALVPHTSILHSNSDPCRQVAFAYSRRVSIPTYHHLPILNWTLHELVRNRPNGNKMKAVTKQHFYHHSGPNVITPASSAGRSPLHLFWTL
jgi:hypothetical protein